MTKIAYFVSAHGYGHAARACAVMEKILSKRPDMRFFIFTQAPEWFFKDSLPPETFVYVEQFTDVGFVQKSPFEADLNATLRRLQKHIPFEQNLLDSLAQVLIRNAIQLVLSDISPLGIASAERAGIPAVLVENFTWDLLYRYYAHRKSEFVFYADYLEDIFRRSTLHFRTKPFMESDIPGLPVDPVSREPKHAFKEVRQKLRIPLKAKAVLISTGGVLTRHHFTDRLKKHKDVYFIVPHDVPEGFHEDNVIVLPHHSSFYHPDLVRASDAVICKSGYSTVAEAYHQNKAIGLVLRPDFPESPYIERFVAENAAHLFMQPDTFRDGSWIDELDNILKGKQMKRKGKRNNGAEAIAAKLMSALLSKRVVR